LSSNIADKNMHETLVFSLNIYPMEQVTLIKDYVCASYARSPNKLAAQYSQVIGYQILNQNIPAVWRDTQGEGVKVAIIDTGCQIDHVDLIGSVINKTNITKDDTAQNMTRSINNKTSSIRYIANLPINYTAKRQRISAYKRDIQRTKQSIRNLSTDVTDYNGHGTVCTGIIRASNNNIGIVGVAPRTNIIVIKALYGDGSGSYEDIANAILSAINMQADVINMSLGGRLDHPALKNAILTAYEANIPIICAAGNSGNINVIDYPAAYPQTISVGALNQNNLRAPFSSTGRRLDFMAPGVSIISTYPTNKYAVMSGTSMSTPWVAGVVALLISKHRKYGGATPVNTVEHVREHLSKTAIDIGVAGKDIMTGYGIIDVRKALSML
jgi:subtilisin family serine protease